MKTHSQANDLLPLYVSGQLSEDQRRAVEQHLPTCAECQADLGLWQSVAGAVVTQSRAAAAPSSLAETALRRVKASASAGKPPAGRSLRRAWNILQSQVPLVRREVWPASAAVMVIGLFLSTLNDQAVFLQFIAPLVAAGCMAVLYGPENDPAVELQLSTPTSPRQILLARLALVFSYNLALALSASLAVYLLVPGDLLLGELILGWLGPMAFLSSAALVLSLAIGTNTAISLTYFAWLARFLVGGVRPDGENGSMVPALLQSLAAYQSFWSHPGLLLSLAALLFGLAFWLAGRETPLTKAP